MARSRILVAVAFGCLAGCGYVGPVLPPSVKIPIAVQDLQVKQRGDQLEVAFTPPIRTTDNLNIRDFRAVQLRIEDARSGSYREYSLPLPASQDVNNLHVVTEHAAVPVDGWQDKSVVARVRTCIRADDTYSDWSNAFALHVTAPIAAVRLTVSPTAAGYRLTWQPVEAGVTYRVMRGGLPMLEIGATTSGEYLDRTAQWSTPYTYAVIGSKSGSEGPESNHVEVNAPDIYPPSAPIELTGIASPQGVELAWQPSPEADVKGYYVYRDSKRVGDLVTSSVWTDTTAEHGKTYQYSVSAVDNAGNESARSEAVTVDVP